MNVTAEQIADATLHATRADELFAEAARLDARATVARNPAVSADLRAKAFRLREAAGKEVRMVPPWFD